jgi:hypothetical protein
MDVLFVIVIVAAAVTVVIVIVVMVAVVIIGVAVKTRGVTITTTVITKELSPILLSPSHMCPHFFSVKLLIITMDVFLIVAFVLTVAVLFILVHVVHHLLKKR